MATDFKDLTMDQLFKAMPYLVVQGIPGRYVYNISFGEVDGVRVKTPAFWVAVENGKVEFGEGTSSEPDATGFTINQGGLDTILAFQTHGLQAGTNAMVMGYVFTTSIKKAEMWFKLLKIGKAELIDALKQVGIEVGDTSLAIYGELMLD